MIHIEMLGLPGSGKTTLFQYAADCLQTHRNVFTEREARICSLRYLLYRKSGVGKKIVGRIADILGKTLWNVIWQNYRYAAMLRFIQCYPALAQFIIHATTLLQRSSEAERLEWAFNFFSTYALFEENLRADDMLFFEEGVCQQAYNLIAFQSPTAQRNALESYLDLIPKPACLIIMNTDAEICEARMEARQRYPVLLQHVTKSERIALLKQRCAIHDQIFQYFQTHHLPAFIVNNNDTLVIAQKMLMQGLKAYETAIFSPRT